MRRWRRKQGVQGVWGASRRDQSETGTWSLQNLGYSSALSCSDRLPHNSRMEVLCIRILRGYLQHYSMETVAYSLVKPYLFVTNSAGVCRSGFSRY